jgi:membrane protein DedA with SNARE-associated domain
MLEDWFLAFPDWVRAHSEWAAPVTFVIAFLESFPGVSIVVPSTALLLGLGALLGSGLLEPVPVVLACMLGGILGDAVGFWAARAIGGRAVRRFLPASWRRGYAWCVVLFRRRGWWAVFIGRFLGPMRAVTPLAAGVVGMRERSFQSANVASAVIWAPVMLMPGSITGWLATQFGIRPDPLEIAAALSVGLLLWLGWQRLQTSLGAARGRR